jgi:hypothetical protein
MAAVAFLETNSLADVDRHWIQGLVFGYTPAAISDFLRGTVTPSERVSSPRSYDSSRKAGTSRPLRVGFRSSSTVTDRRRTRRTSDLLMA